jgi:hypothetical protein
VNVADHTGPPKAFTNVGFGGVKCFMTEGVMRGADYGKSSTWWNN